MTKDERDALLGFRWEHDGTLISQRRSVRKTIEAAKEEFGFTKGQMHGLVDEAYQDKGEA